MTAIVAVDIGGTHARFAIAEVLDGRVLALGEAVTLKTPGSIKDYIHADDVASALLAVSARGSDGTVNIGTGEGVAVGSVARQIAELVGRPDLLRMPERPVADPLDHVVADAGRLRSLGWRPQVTLVSGLRRLVDAAPR